MGMNDFDNPKMVFCPVLVRVLGRVKRARGRTALFFVLCQQVAIASTNRMISARISSIVDRSSFFIIQMGLSDAARAAISRFPASDLTTWNSYTRCKTKDSLATILTTTN